MLNGHLAGITIWRVTDWTCISFKEQKRKSSFRAAQTRSCPLLRLTAERPQTISAHVYFWHVTSSTHVRQLLPLLCHKCPALCRTSFDTSWCACAAFVKMWSSACYNIVCTRCNVCEGSIVNICVVRIHTPSELFHFWKMKPFPEWHHATTSCCERTPWWCNRL